MLAGHTHYHHLIDGSKTKQKPEPPKTESPQISKLFAWICVAML